MSHIQYLEELDYSNSARYDRFNGFDRGDTEVEQEYIPTAEEEAEMLSHSIEYKDSFVGPLDPLVDSEEAPARLWAEIHRLRAAVAGPKGYATWQDAAVAERVRRVKAGARIDLGRYAGTYGGTVDAAPPRTLWQRFMN